MSDENKTQFLSVFLGDLLAVVGGAALGRFLTKEGDKWKLDPTFLREHGPHFAKTMKDEAQFARLLNYLEPNLQKALNEQWLPQLKNHQKSAVILSFSEMTVKPEGGQSDDNITRAANLLTILAELPTNERRNQWAVSENFMKEHEEDYLVVKIMNRLKATPAQIVQVLRDLQTGAKLGAKIINIKYDPRIKQFQTNAADALTRAKARFQRARR